MNLDNIICPVCGSDKSKNLWDNYEVHETAAYYCPPSRNESNYNRFVLNIKKLWSSDTAKVVECTQCDFAFGYPHVGGDEEFYTISTEHKGYDKYKWDYNYAIENLMPTQGKILDIGAGDGLFLDRLGPNFEKFAIEGSIHTRNLLIEKGINVLQNFDEALEKNVGTFDLIVMFQVLEHIAEFNVFLENIQKLLKPKGKFIVSVPNKASIFEKEKYIPRADMIPNHINKWSEKSLAFALNKANLSVEKTIFQQNSVFEEIPALLHNYQKMKATKQNTVANMVYHIKNRNIRKYLLAIISIPSFFKLFPYFFKTKNANLLITAIKK